MSLLESSFDVRSLHQSCLLDYYPRNPVKWAQDKLQEHLWSKQVEIFNSVRDHRRTAVYSCHRIGKSFLGARIAFHWLDTHPPGSALVVTSAHSSTQVKMALWREMARVHSKGRFPGRMNQTEYWMPMADGREEMVAFGRKPAENDPSAFQGTYAKYVLFIMDESCYVDESLWDGAETLISNEHSRILALGNPDDPNTEFAKVCSPGSGWNAVQVGYQDTPNFTGEDVPQQLRDLLIGPTWVEEKRKKWGEDNPLFISKALGQFPTITGDSRNLFSIHIIKDAQERELVPSYPVELGIDVGGGVNKNVIALRRGPVVRIVKEDQNPDTMVTLSNALDQLKETGAAKAKVDYIGIGHGAVDRAKEMAIDQNIKKETPDLARRAGLVVGVNVGNPANDKEQFVNLRAEGYWTLMERFKEGNIDIDPEDDDLAAQLIAIRYKRSGGRIQIESKEDMRRRKIPSPDKADAIMMAYLDEEKEEIMIQGLTW